MTNDTWFLATVENLANQARDLNLAKGDKAILTGYDKSMYDLPALPEAIQKALQHDATDVTGKGLLRGDLYVNYKVYWSVNPDMSLSLTCEHTNPKQIAVTYDVVTDESAENGDTSEAGFERFIPVDDCFDALEQLKNHGPYQDSGDNESYYTSDAEQDYMTGDHTNRAYHLSGFTEAELEWIHDQIFA